MGANDGQSLAWFERNMLRAATRPYTSVTAFEMNPAFHAPLNAILSRLPGGKLEAKAVWTSDGTMEALMQLPGSRVGSKGGMFYNMTASSLQVCGGGVPSHPQHQSLALTLALTLVLTLVLTSPLQVGGVPLNRNAAKLARPPSPALLRVRCESSGLWSCVSTQWGFGGVGADQGGDSRDTADV